MRRLVEDDVTDRLGRQDALVRRPRPTVRELTSRMASRVITQALADMLQRVPEDDLRLFVVAVKVQSAVGSSLAQIIARLSDIVRTRQRLFMQIRALTAQSRMSGMVVGLLPVVVLGMFTIVQPSYAEMLFFDHTGQMILKMAAGLDFGAFLLIRRILRVNF